MPLEIVRSDITTMRVDAVVNAANQSLRGGGGVDGAIHRAAGPGLDEECSRLGGCETGEAKITGGYRLPAKYVIHTVGPIWHGGGQGEEKLLAACYRHSLELARDNKCETVAFPLISAGAYGYPKDQALAVAMDAIGRFLMENDMTVYLVVFARAEYAISKKLFADVQAYIDDHYVAEHSDRDAESNRRSLWLHAPQEAMELDMMLARKQREQQLPDRQEEKAPSAPPLPSAAASPQKKTAKKLSGLLPRRKKELRVAAVEETAYPAVFKQAAKELSVCAGMEAPAQEPDWEKMLRQTDEGFTGMLLRKIDEKGMTDAQCYKKANVDRKLFSKIRSNPAYKPSKATVCAFAVALELPMEEAREMLRKAGFALSRSSKFDIILEYFIQNRIYDVMQINQVLFQFDMPLLGCVSM